MAGVIEAVETAIFGKLAGGATLITEIGGTAIYNRIAPPDTALPYVIFQWQGGGDENLTPSRMRNQVYTVKAVAATLVKAADIDEQIDALLHDQTLTVSGWANFWMAREGDIAYHELEVDNKPVFHTGGMYRIRLGQ